MIQLLINLWAFSVIFCAIVFVINLSYGYKNDPWYRMDLLSVCIAIVLTVIPILNIVCSLYVVGYAFWNYAVQIYKYYKRT